MASISVSLQSASGSSITILASWRNCSSGQIYIYPKINQGGTTNFTASSGSLTNGRNGLIFYSNSGSVTITFSGRNLSTTTTYGASVQDGIGGPTDYNYIQYPPPSYNDYNDTPYGDYNDTPYGDYNDTPYRDYYDTPYGDYNDTYTSWIAPYHYPADRQITNTENTSSYSGSIQVYYYRASYFNVIVPCGGTLTFTTTIGSKNPDPYGYITKTEPNQGAPGQSRDASFVYDNNDTQKNDDKNPSVSYDCEVKYSEKFLGSRTYYVALNLAFSGSGSTYIPYTLTFTPYKGTMSFYNNTGTFLGTYTNTGANTMTPPTWSNPTNFIFKGWSTNKNATTPKYAKGATISTDQDSLSLYGIWYFSLSFNLNGGSGTTNALTYYNNIAQTITMPSSSSITKSPVWGSETTTYSIIRYKSDNITPLHTNYVQYKSKTTYTLSSWNTTNTGSGVNFTPGGSYSTSDTNFIMSNGATQLYAKWSSNTNNACYSSATFTIYPNEQYLEGCEFLGYSTAKGSSTVTYKANTTYTRTEPGNLYLYPVFKKKIYFGKDKEWKECKLYYGINNEWKEIELFTAIGGKWK